MKKLKEDIYAMGTMEIADVRETNKCKNTAHSLVDVDPSEHFTGYGLGKILVQIIHVLRRETVILSCHDLADLDG